MRSVYWHHFSHRAGEGITAHNIQVPAEARYIRILFLGPWLCCHKRCFTASSVSPSYTEDPWIMFRESAPFWLKARRGHMPYYMAAHGLYAQAIHEMLVQDWRGKMDLFPACPFEEASFRLQVGGRVMEAKKAGNKVTACGKLES